MRLGKKAIRAGKSKPTMKAMVPRDGEDMPDRHHFAPVQGGEEGEEAGGGERGHDEHPAPVHPVGDDPARKRCDDGGDRGGGAQEPELERGAAQLVDEPPLAHDEELERPHRGGGAEPVAAEARLPDRREARAGPCAEAPPPHGAPADSRAPRGSSYPSRMSRFTPLPGPAGTPRGPGRCARGGGPRRSDPGCLPRRSARPRRLPPARGRRPSPRRQRRRGCARSR